MLLRNLGSYWIDNIYDYVFTNADFPVIRSCEFVIVSLK